MSSPNNVSPLTVPPTKVLLVDDHPVVRDGLKFSLSSIEGLTVCGEAGEVSEALLIAEQTHPDLIVLDLVMGGRDGYEAITLLREIMPKAKLLVFSMSPEELFAQNCINAGADGYLMKSDGSSKLLVAIQRIMAGDVYLSENLTSKVTTRYFKSRRRQDVSSLTERELQVFNRLGEGKGTSDIAKELQLSVKTVATHRENMKAKLGLLSGTELNRLAISFKLSQRGLERDGLSA